MRLRLRTLARALPLVALLAFCTLRASPPSSMAAGDISGGTPSLVRQEVVTTAAATGDGGNGWGPHKVRIVRTNDDTVYTTFSLPGSDYLHRTWVLARRGSNGWQAYATGAAGHEPVNLLRSPNNRLYVVSWPNQMPAIWDSSSRRVTSVPGNWSASDWPYAAAGINSIGDVTILQDVCACSGTTPNAPGEYALSTRSAKTGRWQSNSFGSDYRYAYMFLLPASSGSMTAVGTRDVLWSELGYAQPADTFGYVFNAVRDWLIPTTGQPATPSLVHEELPTAAYAYALAYSTDVYVNTLGRTHVLYAEEGSSTGGYFRGRHAVLQNGVVIEDVPNPVIYPNLSRIIQDTTGRFYIFSVCGGSLAIAAGLPGDTDGTQLSAPATLPFQNSYACDTQNNFIAAPRGGTPLADHVDGVFDTGAGAEWIYHRLQLR